VSRPDGGVAAAALCPCPPLLLPGTTGAAEAAPDLRAACGAAVSALLAASPDTVVLVAADGPPVTARSFAPMLRPDGASPAPLGVAVGRALLERAGWGGPVEVRAVAPDAAPDACAAVGAALDGGTGRVAVLALGDGSARRGPKAPGYVDERAHALDAAVLAALRAGDWSALLDVGPGLAADLLAGGRPAWQVLAGALRGRAGGAEVLYADDPFGVQYVVATWSRSASAIASTGARTFTSLSK
jgi:hypothetical protein